MSNKETEKEKSYRIQKYLMMFIFGGLFLLMLVLTVLNWFI